MARNLQQHILDVASELFYSQGIKATGVDAIVKAAGTTKMSLYKYFPSKDDLVVAHLSKSRVKLQGIIEAELAQSGADPRRKLLAVFDVFERLQASPAFRGCPFINASAEFADAGSPVQQAAADFSEGFRRLLATLAAEAGARDPDSLAKHLSMLIAGALVREQMQRGSAPMRSAREAAEVLIGHACAPSGPAEPA
ncbi:MULTISPECIES: TetR/AcrR family transcriptional regulator [Methylomonas]|uniref:TetR/AcrR family transcriptional regulator n=1 Tax=Methylomonas TaxID=416 RepID=UPI0007C93AE5|nr:MULTISPECIES: TetR/AcrR family transcriptional regulator [Methylomonas]ANE57174.1 TetR family transcriptional regulator [Methylomonas sp. DH-1]WNB75603.1 TetR/AcrR family transcriptional regulator [Methylomonas koyamae]BBL60386.1 TetR family transcriptional regulator [Methylomonas koyamae]